MNNESQNLDTPHKNFTNVEVISDDLGKFELFHHLKQIYFHAIKLLGNVLCRKS